MTYTVSSGTLNSSIPYHTDNNNDASKLDSERASVVDGDLIVYRRRDAYWLTRKKSMEIMFRWMVTSKGSFCTKSDVMSQLLLRPSVRFTSRH